ncbi:MAG TPA: CHAP domain-containing protein [Ktedonobacteraceae bacterium]
MPFQDDRADSKAGLVPMPGLNQSEPLSRPLPMGEDATRTLRTLSPARGQESSTGQFPSFVPSTTDHLSSINLTRVLTTTLPRVTDSTTSQRIPVVIKSAQKKRMTRHLTTSAHKRRRLVVSLLGVLMLTLVTCLALYTVAPLSHDNGLSWNPLAHLPGSSVYNNQNSGQPKLIVQATATAVYHQQTDGYGGGTGNQQVGNGIGSLNWPVGQCTYWANYEYHRLTGRWVSWNGNANQWVAGARAAGWNVSTSPHVPSIIVLMGVQGANSYYGHVAVVESLVAGASPVTVHASNMNWYAVGGGWDIESFWNFTVGGGVYFVWHK